MKLNLRNKHIIYCIIIIITLVMLYTMITKEIIGFSKHAQLLPNGLLFVFFHVSLIHYALNLLAMISLIREVKHINTAMFCLIIILTIIANIATVGIFCNQLTVGISGVFCGIIGYLAVDQYMTQKRTVFIVESLGIVMFTFFIPMVSIEAHLSGMGVGIFLGLCQHFLFKYRK